MALSERLAYILTLDSRSAVQGLQKVGQTAEKELGKTDQKLERLGGNMRRFGAGAVAFAGVAGAGLVKLASDASGLEESVNAVNVTFGDAAGGILKLGEDAARAVGLSKTEFNSLAVQFSSFAQTVAGEGGDVVGTMDDLTTRAADFASVMNLDVAEAARVFQSGLAGETEPLKKFGIDLSAASVGAYAVANGITESAKSMTEAEKVQARYGLLMEQTAKTAGDFANTSDGAANQQRILTAEFANLRAEIGAGVLPMMTSVLQVATKVTGAFSKLSPETKGLIGRFAGLATVGVGLLGTLSFIGGQAIKMRSNFTNLDGSLNRTGKAAKGLGVAMGVAGVAMLAYGLHASEAAKDARQFSEALEKISRATDDQLVEGLREYITAVSAFQDQSPEETFREMARESLDAAIKIRDQAAANSELSAELNQVGLDTATMNAVIDEETAARKRATEAAEAASEATSDQTDAAEDATDANEDLTDATEDTAEATVDLDNRVRELTQTIHDDIQASKDLRAERRRAADATYDAEDAEDAYIDALEEMNRVNADSESSERDRAAATRDAVRATQTMIEKQLEAEGVIVDSERGQRLLTERMAAHATFLGGTMGAELIAHTARLNGIPEEKITEIEALLNEGMVAEALAKLNEELSKAEAQVQVTPVGLEAARERIEAILGRRVNLSVNTYVPPTSHKPGRAGLTRGAPDESGRFSLDSILTGDGSSGALTRGGVTNNYNITVNVERGTDGAEVGRELVDYIRAYERRAGAGWRI